MAGMPEDAALARPSLAVARGAAAEASTRFGPSDRVSFLAEQRRRRRQNWRLSALSALAVVVIGLPLSVVLTPLVYALLLGALRVASLLVPVPAGAWVGVRRVALLLPGLFNALGGGPSGVPTSKLFAGALLVVAPGVVAALLGWLALRALFLRTGGDGLLLALRCREPRPGDLEEQQLVDTVAEMAIAAGLPAPRVRVLDSLAANAAVVGTSPGDAVIVATRGLLQVLSREQTEAVVGHLVACAGEGDLRAAVTITSAFHAMALTVTSFQALIGLSGSAWRDLAHAARWALLQRGDPAAAEAVATMLEREISDQPEDGIAGVINATAGQMPKSALARAARAFPPLKILLFPLYLPYVGVLLLAMEVFMLRTLLAGPLVMLVWHTRRYLADAMAVQLTRDPDALAEALEKLARVETRVARSRWAAHLFFVAPRGAQGAGDDSDSGAFGGFVGSHPSTRRRLKRLAAMGSALATADTPARRAAWRWLVAPLMALLALLVALPLALSVALIFALAGGASLLMAGVALAVIARLLL